MFKKVQGKNIGKFLLLWLPVAVWVGFTFYLSSRQGLAIGEGPIEFWTRKPAHIGEYAILFLLLMRAVKGSFGVFWKWWELNLGVGVLAFVYAITDEIHQFFVPTRAGEIGDLGFDLLGIFLGIALVHFYRRRP